MEEDHSCDCPMFMKEFQIGPHWYASCNVTCLGVAILNDDIEAVETSLRKGCNVNFDKIEEIRHRGMTPLIMACRWASFSVVSLLIGHPDIEIDKRNGDGETALAWAATKPENLDMVKLLVEAGANIYLRDAKGYSNLHRAVEAGALEIVKYLHSKGSSLITQIVVGINNHTTPLWSAVDKQNVPMIRYLVENWYVKHGNIEIIKDMIEEGVDEHDGEYEEIISMLEAAEADAKSDEVLKSCGCSIVEKYRMYYDHDLACDSPKFENLSCLGVAIVENDIEAVKTSLSNGCDVNFNETYTNCTGGWTPLMLACAESSLPIVSLLVGQPGIKIDRTNYDGESALSWAVKRDDNLDMVKFLVEAGADPDMRSRDGYSHLHQAADNGQLDIVKYLQAKGAYIDTRIQPQSETPLYSAARNGDLDMVKYLVSQGSNLEYRYRWGGKVGSTALNTAVANGKADVVKFLIEQGADVNAECDSNDHRDDVTRYNLEVARDKLEEYCWRKDKAQQKLYEEIICVLKEAGAKEPDDEVIKKLVLDTLDAIMRIWAEKIGIVAWAFREWPNNGDLPECVRKLKVMTDRHEVWLAMVRALVEVIPPEHPIGSIAIAILIQRCPQPVHLNPQTNVDTYLKVLEMASSFEANDIRHCNMSIILSAIARNSQRNEICQLILTPDMLDYLFGNLNSGALPEVATFSLLALECLTDQHGYRENPNAEIVRKRFCEFSPEEHPLLRIEKLIDSDDFAEKQAGFCARWYLDNLWTIDNQDVRSQTIVDNSNSNARLISKSWYLKVGPNGLEIRGNALCFESAMSSVQVDGGSWYYEVTIVTGGFMQIGWATEQSKFLRTQGYGVGDDEFGQSYDGCRQVVWYNRLDASGIKPRGWESPKRRSKSESHIESWKAGDVVGSLIDIEHQEILFSVNGVNIRSKPYKDVFEKVEDGFFAAVSLMSFQQCQVNFGRDPFKHPPEERAFKPLNEATIQSG